MVLVLPILEVQTCFTKDVNARMKIYQRAKTIVMMMFTAKVTLDLQHGMRVSGQQRLNALLDAVNTTKGV